MVGKILPKALKGANPLGVVESLTGTIQAFISYKKSREIEETKRVEHREMILTYIKAIESEEKIFIEFFTYETQRRQKLYQNLWKLVDFADENHETELFCGALDNILRIVSEDPFTKYKQKVLKQTKYII